MTTKNGPRHVVVDGSNIATEGRSLPSLAQLSEAVASFMEEHPDATITVVVDATFGHRIDKREVAEFEAGISNNELVAPPAGAIGRGDAFVLSIAQKAGASILSNDSFQEFHADYEWLFDEGRLIGGKPVPHVGWVFVNRSPVRGPVSRKAMQGAKVARRDEARRPQDGRRQRKSAGQRTDAGAEVAASTPDGERGRILVGRFVDRADVATVAPAPAPRAGEVVNELMPFLEFVEHHPIGTSVNGIVDTYSSHGAYISIGTDGVRGYIPLRLMSDPPPPSARKVMQIGEAVTVVVVSFAAARRSIDCAMPDMAAHAPVDTDPLATEPVEHARSGRRGRGRKAAATPATVDERVDQLVDQAVERLLTTVADGGFADVPVSDVAAPARASRKATAKKAAAAPTPVEPPVEPIVEPIVEVAPARKSPAGRTTAKQAAVKKAPAKKAPAKKAAARKSPATKAAAKKAAVSKAPAQERATKSAAKKAPPASAPVAVDPGPTAEARPDSIAPTPIAPAPAAAVDTGTVGNGPGKNARGKAAAKKAPAKKPAAKSASADTVAADTAPVTKAVAKKAAPRNATPRNSTARNSTPTKSTPEVDCHEVDWQKVGCREGAGREGCGRRGGVDGGRVRRRQLTCASQPGTSTRCVPVRNGWRNGSPKRRPTS